MMLSVAYLEVFQADPVDRIGMIKAGLLATEAKRLIEGLAIKQSAAFAALNLSAATINRKAARGQTLAMDESERVLGIASLVGQVEAMVAQSGTTTGFDAAGWLSRWLEEPVPALGGRRPLDLIDTMEGQTLVSETLARMQSGAYA